MTSSKHVINFNELASLVVQVNKMKKGFLPVELKKMCKESKVSQEIHDKSAKNFMQM